MRSQFEVHRAKDCAIFKFPLRISAEADEIIKVAAIEANTINFIVSLQLFRPHNTSNPRVPGKFKKRLEAQRRWTLLTLLGVETGQYPRHPKETAPAPGRATEAADSGWTTRGGGPPSGIGTAGVRPRLLFPLHDRECWRRGGRLMAPAFFIEFDTRTGRRPRGIIQVVPGGVRKPSHSPRKGRI
jgi:hypothetical protein